MIYEMHDVNDGIGPFDTVTVATGDEAAGPAGTVTLDTSGRSELTSAEARALAHALLRAADAADWASGVDTFPAVLAGDLQVGDVLISGKSPEPPELCVAVEVTVTRGRVTVVWQTEGNMMTTYHGVRDSVTLRRRGASLTATD
ncbi:hypothetical protein OTB20_08670 [Streptomyces sp. H27-H1]|uniref:hypothetical protein n=1 Tax=Streptomyces sp. H27-H1 TaxID=2996461 RepID=UPI0022719E92|nr:hypothetical protein [Streptomyces sp. H27-H1]MCY0926279.1 hypothetical protein [Streptomyces sp. H27-H1]